MPELPEVETIKKDLEKMIIGKKIIGVKVVQKKSIKNSADKFIKALQNNHVINIGRKGKLLIFELNNKNYLLAHLRMTGQLVYVQPSAKYFTEYLKFNKTLSSRNEGDASIYRLHFGEKTSDKHIRVILCFEDKSKLYFNDSRRFGYLQIANRKEKDKIIKKMGIDVLDKNFYLEILKKLFRNKKRMLKSILLDQKIIAGVGNIYADEICFDAKLNPSRGVNKLNDKELKRLYNSIGNILKLAVKHRGTTFRDYIDANGRKGNFAKFLKVYGREKEGCINCGEKSIKKIKLAGRATRYCENCQK